MRKGKLIVIEGADGSGKSTLAGKLADTLNAVKKGQPGGTPVAEALRGIFKTQTTEVITPFAEICVLMAARAQLWTNVIYEALENGHDVVLDRHLLSTLVYQIDLCGKSNDEDFVRHLNNKAFPYTPDIMVYLDVDEETSLERRGIRDTSDRKEASLDFQALIKAYKRRVEGMSSGSYNQKSQCKTLITIDASHSIEEVYMQTLNEVLAVL